MQNHRGGVILSLGIVSIVVCGLVGPFAFVMGKRDLEEMDEGRMDPEGRGLTNAGKICGAIGCVIAVLQLLYVVIVVPLLFMSIANQ